MTPTDSRIAHRSAETNARLLAFWIGLGVNVSVAYQRWQLCGACYGAKRVEVFYDSYTSQREYDWCSVCKGTGKR